MTDQTTLSTIDIERRLQRAMSRHTMLAGNIVALTRLTGGATKETWSFDVEADGAGGVVPLILQRMPRALADVMPATASKDMSAAQRPTRPPKLGAREDALVMQAARAGGVPAPVVRLVLDEADGLGDGYVTERVDGDTLGRRIVSDAALASARPSMAAQAGEILANIHAVPLASVPFLDTLEPADEVRIYGGLLDRYELHHPALTHALRWVRENLPPSSRTTLVHADFRCGNLIVGADGIRCVLDWEIARIGDPMQDLGVLCMKTWRFGGSLPVGGFGTREDLYAAYERASGVRVDPKRVRFWEAFSNLKWAIGCVRRGLSAAVDGGPAGIELASIGRRLEEPLWDFLELAFPIATSAPRVAA